MTKREMLVQWARACRDMAASVPEGELEGGMQVSTLDVILAYLKTSIGGDEVEAVGDLFVENAESIANEQFGLCLRCDDCWRGYKPGTRVAVLKPAEGTLKGTGA